MGKDTLSIGDRMKNNYENVFRLKLPKRMPAIIRLDGKAFHSLTRGLDRPFDQGFIDLMIDTALYVCENIQNAQLAYVQSDEISILMTDYQGIDTQAWFGGNIQKITSISAALASTYFSSRLHEIKDDHTGQFDVSQYGLFDSRVFVIPKEEVTNYFIWRQQDWTRNSIQMLSRSHFSQKQLHKKDKNAMMDMLYLDKQVNWNDLDTWLKRGTCIIKEEKEIEGGQKRAEFVIDKGIPIFTQDRDYIEKKVI